MTKRSPRTGLVGDRRGAALVSFVLVMPFVLLVTLALSELVLFVFDYHRASEAARRAVREVVLADAVGDLSGLTPGSPVICRGGESLSCGDAGVATGGATAFARIFDAARGILPAVEAANVEVAYRDGNLGSADQPGGPLALVDVSLLDIRHRFLLLGLMPGAPRETTFSVRAGGTVGRRYLEVALD